MHQIQQANVLLTKLVNKFAKIPDDIFDSQDIQLVEHFHNIYDIFWKREEHKQLIDTPLVLKVYQNLDFAIYEARTLEKLERLELNVPKLIYFHNDKQFPFVIMTKLSGKDLSCFLDDVQARKEQLGERDVQHIVRKIFLLLQRIHEVNLIHSDIKLENIMYDEKTGEVGIIDFEGNKYTIEYICPEMILNKSKITPKVDVWSVGVIAYYLLTNGTTFPFKGSWTSKRKLQFPSYFQPEAVEFLSNLLETNSKNRFTCEEALEHDWLQFDE